MTALLGLTRFDSPWLLPLAIFLAELCVVTLGTIRIVFVSRGKAFDAKAFYSVDELHSAAQGIFPGGRPPHEGIMPGTRNVLRLDAAVTAMGGRPPVIEPRPADNPLANSA